MGGINVTPDIIYTYFITIIKKRYAQQRYAPKNCLA